MREVLGRNIAEIWSETHTLHWLEATLDELIAAKNQFLQGFFPVPIVFHYSG